MVGLPRGPDGVEHEVELWSRNVDECVAALLGNVGFQDHIAYKPTKVFKDVERTERLYGEAWTADWWWETQVSPRASTINNVLTLWRRNSPSGQQLRR
jgi:Plavaka transposase